MLRAVPGHKAHDRCAEFALVGGELFLEELRELTTDYRHRDNLTGDLLNRIYCLTGSLQKAIRDAEPGLLQSMEVKSMQSSRLRAIAGK